MIKNYKEQIQKIQWLIYENDELTDLEKCGIKRVIDYIQAKVKLYYYEKTYKNDSNYLKLQCLLDEKRKKVIHYT